MNQLFSRTCVQDTDALLPIFLSKTDMADIACTFFNTHIHPHQWNPAFFCITH